MRPALVGLSIWLAAASFGYSQETTLPADTAIQSDDAKSDAKADDQAPAVDCCANGCCHRSPRLFGGAELLYWWIQGQPLPPLVTTSPPGTPFTDAGVLGVPGTRILFGDDRVDDDGRFGGRFTLGYWFDDCQTCGIGGDIFFLEQNTSGFHGDCKQFPILARPFYRTDTNSASSQITCFPGVAGGSIDVATDSEFWGADAYLRKCCRRGCGWRVDWLAGFRYLHLEEGLSINELVISLVNPLDDPDAPPLGTTFQLFDIFDTENDFYGATLGLWWTLNRGRLSLDVLTRLGFGATRRTAHIDGATTITVPGEAPANFKGGLLALSSNIGNYESTKFSWVPEIGINLGYQVGRHMKAFVGYTFIYWTNVARPGDQIDLTINPNFLPPPIAGGPNRPRFSFQDDDLWVQGVSIGLAFNY